MPWYWDQYVNHKINLQTFFLFRLKTCSSCLPYDFASEALHWVFSKERTVQLSQKWNVPNCECLKKYEKQHTPRKINIEPENNGLEDDFPFPGVYVKL